eukprot:GFYU01094562.1.p1 GENE.GFYU01094562.1~~GFYU01094562.1.p1  ORF type:complete len:110 (-),score=10.81 GFYU01094562.1:96-425(-)
MSHDMIADRSCVWNVVVDVVVRVMNSRDSIVNGGSSSESVRSPRPAKMTNWRLIGSPASLTMLTVVKKDVEPHRMWVALQLADSASWARNVYTQDCATALYSVSGAYVP